ncbi:MAG: tetratricopeptide repeat protein [Limisphaerales bacterium]
MAFNWIVCPLCGTRIDLDEPALVERLQESIATDIKEFHAAKWLSREANFFEETKTHRIEDWSWGSRLEWPAAQWLLARSFYAAPYLPQAEIDRVETLYKSAAEKGFPPAQNDYGYLLAQRYKNYEARIKWVTRASAQGYIEAKFNSVYLLKELGRPEPELVAALRLVADLGFPRAQDEMGSLHYHGFNGICRQFPKDYRVAFEYYLKAATQGFGEAQRTIAWLYFKGEGVGRNISAAREWLVKAERQKVYGTQFLRNRLDSPWWQLIDFVRGA